jgi:hypothetical protein
MHGTGHADDLVGLQMPSNKADAVSCERLRSTLYRIGLALMASGRWPSERNIRKTLVIYYFKIDLLAILDGEYATAMHNVIR